MVGHKARQYYSAVDRMLSGPTTSSRVPARLDGESIGWGWPRPCRKLAFASPDNIHRFIFAVTMQHAERTTTGMEYTTPAEEMTSNMHHYSSV